MPMYGPQQRDLKGGMRRAPPAVSVLPWKHAATAVYQPSQLSAAGTTSMTRKAHFARDTITALRLGYITSYRTVTLGRQNLGAALPIKAWIEYPSGTYTAVPFSGSTAPTLADNTLTISDATPVSIPNGAQFWIWTWSNGQCPAGTTSISNFLNSSMGEGSVSSATASQVPTAPSATVPGGQTTIYMPTVMILAQTAVKSSIVFGTSRTISQGSPTTNSSLDRGAICRAIGPNMAYANFGIQGDSASPWLHDPVLPQIAAYFTHIIGNDVTNDAYVQVGTLAGMQAYDQRWAARFNGKPYLGQTIEPNATGTPWQTTAQQTVTAQGTVMAAWNAALHSSYFAPFLDVGGPVIDPTSLNLWAANSTGLTTDGLHPDETGVLSQVATATSGTTWLAQILAAANLSTTFVPTATSVSAAFSTAAPKFGTGNLSSGNLAVYGISPTSYPSTYCGWFKTTTTGSYTIFGQGNHTSATIASGAIGGTAGGKAFTASGTYNDGAWHHIAIVTTQTGGVLYVDGAQISTSAAPITAPTVTGFAFAIGAQGRASLSGGSPSFVGSCDEFTTWNYGMTAAQVAAEFALTLPHVGTEAGLIALMHLDDATIIMGSGA